MRGGLLGRPVEFVCYDNEGDPERGEALYKQLIDENEVDLVIGGYGTNSIQAAMPVVVPADRFFVGLMGLGTNDDQKYPNYFAMIPTEPAASSSLTEGSSRSLRLGNRGLQPSRCYQPIRS